MKKSTKAKSPKSSRQSSAAEVPEAELPNLVMAMAKLTERLENIERKMDQVLGRVSSLPSEFKNAIQQSGRPSQSQPQTSQPRPQQPMHQHSSYSQPSSARPIQNQTQHLPQNQGNRDHGRRERPMYQAVCADCKKSCEVPFKPSDRPVYCKECFAARKSTHGPVKAPLSPRSIAAAYVNKKAGYPPPSPAAYRSQISAPVSSGAAVLAPEKSKGTAQRSEKAKSRKKK